MTGPPFLRPDHRWLYVYNGSARPRRKKGLTMKYQHNDSLEIVSVDTTDEEALPPLNGSFATVFFGWNAIGESFQIDRNNPLYVLGAFAYIHGRNGNSR